jgi:subtilisin family serine protease
MRTPYVIRGLLFAALACAVLAGASGASAGPSPAERSYGTAIRGNFVPGQVIVGYRAHISRAEVARVHGRVPARVTQRFSSLRIDVVRLAPGLSVSQAVRRYERNPSVAFAEPNYVRTPQADLFSDLWALENSGQSHPVANSVPHHVAVAHVGSNDADIDASDAWLTTKGDPSTVIAVIDTGVDVGHPDLSGQLWQNPGETCVGCLPGVDDDHNGKKDDINGWDFANNDKTLLSANHFSGYNHGTHVAGTIAGDDDNDGIVGVCPFCKIMVLKIARDSGGQLLLSAEIAALAYAKAHSVRIANMSFGGPDWSNAERNAIHNSGLLAVVSAGNEALDNDMYLYADRNNDGNVDAISPSFPASFTLGNILAVSASNDQDENAYGTECYDVFGSKPDCAFTNWGHDSVDLAAPGVDIESSLPSSKWQTWDGTSMAAPHVAGAAGLVLSQNPSYRVAELKNAIMNSVDTPPSLGTIYIPSYVDQTGHPRTKMGAFSRTTGRVNALNALTAGTSSATPMTDGNVNGAKSFSGSSVNGSVSWPADVNDVKKKKLFKGHKYRVTLVVPAHRDYDLFVWKPGSKEIWRPGKIVKASRRIGSGDEVIRFTAGSTGTYYFQVMAWLFKSGSYKLTVKKLA